jgi:hypothetical protein
VLQVHGKLADQPAEDVALAVDARHALELEGREDAGIELGLIAGDPTPKFELLI